MVDQAAPNPVFALCEPCGRSYWVATPQQPNCLICGNPPSHVIPFSLVAGASAPGTRTSPEPVAPADNAPVVFNETCPHCENELVIELTDTALIVRAGVPAPAGEAPSDQPEASSSDESAEPALTETEGDGGADAPLPPPPSPSDEPAVVTS